MPTVDVRLVKCRDAIAASPIVPAWVAKTSVRHVLLGLLLLPIAAIAQMRGTGEYLARMDTDRSGRVSVSEYQAWMGYAFERMDTDRNGVLSGAELPGSRGKPVLLSAHRESLAQAFARQDRNRDGQLDAKELAAPPQ